MVQKLLLPLLVVLVLVGGGAVLAARALEPAGDGHSHDAAGNDALFNEPAAQTVRVTMADISFVPASIKAAPGSLIELAMRNEGVLDHDFTIARIDVDQATRRTGAVPAAHQHLAQYSVHIALGSKQEARVRLHLHDPGTYKFFCTVEGHEQAGMRGMLTIE